MSALHCSREDTARKGYIIVLRWNRISVKTMRNVFALKTTTIGKTSISQPYIYYTIDYGYVFTRCICEDGWTGKNCSDRLENCIDLQCQNGGICSEEQRKCECPVGYSGKFCEDSSPMADSVTISSIFPRSLPDGECSMDNCQNVFSG